jgi:hypothetical protein
VLIHYNASSIYVKFNFQISGPCTYNSLCMSWNSAPLASTPVWARDFASPEELVKEFNRECRIVQKGRKFLSLWDKMKLSSIPVGGGLMIQLHHGMVKLLPIMLGKVQGESIRAKLGDSPNLMHKDKGHFMKLRSSCQIR